MANFARRLSRSPFISVLARFHKGTLSQCCSRKTIIKTTTATKGKETKNYFLTKHPNVLKAYMILLAGETSNGTRHSNVLVGKKDYIEKTILNYKWYTAPQQCPLKWEEQTDATPRKQKQDVSALPDDPTGSGHCQPEIQTHYYIIGRKSIKERERTSINNFHQSSASILASLA